VCVCVRVCVRACVRGWVRARYGSGGLQTYGMLKFTVACSRLDYILLIEGSTLDACFEI